MTAAASHLDATGFMRAFLACAVASEPPELPSGAGPWTEHMWSVLADTASTLHLFAATRWRQPHGKLPTHVSSKEWLWDWSFYDSLKEYARPRIVLEHENRWDHSGFGDDLWKVLVAGAPLRVMIGYASSAAMLEKRIGVLQVAADQSGHPDHGEDLVVLRFACDQNPDLAGRWRWWRRRTGEAKFTEQSFAA